MAFQLVHKLVQIHLNVKNTGSAQCQFFFVDYVEIKRYHDYEVEIIKNLKQHV